MPFKDSLKRFADKLQQQIPAMPIEQIGTAPSINYGNKPNASAAAAGPAYWQADFSPSTPVSANFAHECGDWGWGNNELENYTDGAENSFHNPADSTLVLRAVVASGRYTSARLTSHQRLARRSGYVEARIAPPSARGIWPAFWLLPAEPFKWPEDGEVDIMEHWNGEGVNHACLHWGQYSAADRDKHRVVRTGFGTGITGTRSFGFAWSQEADGARGRCVWYIDGKAVMRADKPAGTRSWEDWRVLLNVAIGGDVCKGAVPADGAYDMVVHDLRMCESPVGGWERFEKDWKGCREGKPE